MGSGREHEDERTVTALSEDHNQYERHLVYLSLRDATDEVSSPALSEKVSKSALIQQIPKGNPQRSVIDVVSLERTLTATPKSCTMPQVKTSWEDLANLGWPIQQVYEKANAARGGSMEGKGDLSLNNGVAAEYQ